MGDNAHDAHGYGHDVDYRTLYGGIGLDNATMHKYPIQHRPLRLHKHVAITTKYICTLYVYTFHYIPLIHPVTSTVPIYMQIPCQHRSPHNPLILLDLIIRTIHHVTIFVQNVTHFASPYPRPVSVHPSISILSHAYIRIHSLARG